MVIHWLEQVDSKNRRRWEGIPQLVAVGSPVESGVLTVHEVNGPNGITVGRDFIPPSYRYEVVGEVLGSTSKTRVSFNGVCTSEADAKATGARLFRLLHVQEGITKAVKTAIT